MPERWMYYDQYQKSFSLEYMCAIQSGLLFTENPTAKSLFQYSPITPKIKSRCNLTVFDAF